MTRKLLAIACLAIAPCAGAGLVASAEALYDEAMAVFDRGDLDVAGATLWQCWCSPASVSVRMPTADRVVGSSCGAKRWGGSAGLADVELERVPAPAYAFGDLVVGDGAFWLPLPAPGGPLPEPWDQAASPGPGEHPVAMGAAGPAPMRTAVRK